MIKLSENEIYSGFEGIGLDGISDSKLTALFTFVSKAKNSFQVAQIENQIKGLDKLSLEEIKDIAKSFYTKYFRLPKINTISPETLNKIWDYYDSVFGKIDYKIVNTFLNEQELFDIPIDIDDNNEIYGRVNKSIVTDRFNLLDKDRKKYFLSIELGRSLTLMTPSLLVHEYAHILQENVLGYAKDCLNAEIISMFLEKVMAYEIDSNGVILALNERLRFAHLISECESIKEEKNDMFRYALLVYIKATIIAGKMFDMYLREKRLGEKDKYMYDIQDVFDGKKTVEDVIMGRNITIKQCQKPNLLARRAHLK